MYRQRGFTMIGLLLTMVILIITMYIMMGDLGGGISSKAILGF